MNLRYFPAFLLGVAFLVAVHGSALANMASPQVRGTGTGLPFVSTHARVLHEQLHITPGADFKTCTYDVVYDIFTDTAGLRIPLLFIAHHYQPGSMQIWVDGRSVEVMQVPEQFFYRKSSPLSQFLGVHDSILQEIQVFEIEWEKGFPVRYNQDECQYFETDLAAGAHQVRVTYIAEVWRDRHEWLADEKFMYALDPASHWFAFGKLDVTLDARQAPYPVTTNLGQPDSGDIGHVAVWHFDSLPALTTLDILSVPRPQGNGQLMMDFGMQGFMWASGGLCALLHLLLMWRWRKRNADRKFSWIWLLGSIIVPFVAMLIYCLSFDWINAAIGPAAAHYGGYYVLIFVLYPFAVIGYGLLTLLADYLLKRHYRK